MKENQTQQLKEQILKSHKILITTKRSPTGDGLATSLALFLLFKKLNKNSDIIIDGFVINDNYSFLPEIKNIKPQISTIKKFTLNINIAQTGLEDLAYDIQGSNLKIYLSPKQGEFEPEDIKLETGEFSYDLIIAVDTPELEALGKLYDYHRDIFFKLPLINIDHHLTNEQYGHLNIIDITASSASEIVFELGKNLLPEGIDSAIATCLLTGLIDKTKSFKSAGVTPRSLSIASELMKLGANRKEIVSKLYQTKTISMLKLWGKILSRLQSDNDLKIAWSKADLSDFTESGANFKDVPGIAEELITSSPQAEIVVLFYQTNLEEIKVMVYSQGSISTLALAKAFSPIGDKTQGYFSIHGNLNEIEKQVITEIKTQLAGFKQV